MTNKNLAIWDALREVDPKQTKPFQRSGGFKGTATKPIWLTMRMTEYFGPCGVGWGTTAPAFQVINAGDEILVYCTVGLWHTKPEYLVYGVGGDKVRALQKNGAFNSDEAFKAAHTDAIGNAMKSIGMIADIHMGKFDDSKYVREMSQEFSDKSGDSVSNADALVADSLDWIRKQTDPQAIHKAWNENMEWYNGLSKEHQSALQVARDETLKKIAPPSDVSRKAADEHPLAGADIDWKIKADEIKKSIDDALDSLEVRQIIEGADLAELTKHSKTAGTFLRDRATKKLAMIQQKPGTGGINSSEVPF